MIHAIAYDGTYVVFATYDPSGYGRIHRGTIVNNQISPSTIYGPVSNTIYTTLAFYDDGTEKLMIGAETSTTAKIYYATLSSSLTLTQTGDTGFSSATDFLSMAGQDEYLYLIRHNDTSETNSSKKLFYSHWWYSF